MGNDLQTIEPICSTKNTTYQTGFYASRHASTIGIGSLEGKKLFFIEIKKIDHRFLQTASFS